MAGRVGPLDAVRAFVAAICAFVCVANAQPAGHATPDALREGYAAFRAQPDTLAIRQALFLRSTATAERIRGEIYAIEDRPFRDVRLGLERADNWCGMLILHLNVKHCRAAAQGRDAAVYVWVVTRFDQPLESAQGVRFEFTVAGSSDDYLAVDLIAPTGPLGTRDYRISVEAAPQGDGRTLLHMTFAYSSGIAARVATNAYLATSGRNKVGFSVVGRRPDGDPILVGGVRGIVERNAMRYFLTIDAFLGAVSQPAPSRMQKSLQNWFDATEVHATQLHEIDRAGYLEMKGRELRRLEARAALAPDG